MIQGQPLLQGGTQQSSPRESAGALAPGRHLTSTERGRANPGHGRGHPGMPKMCQSKIAPPRRLRSPPLQSGNLTFKGRGRTSSGALDKATH